jgi:hypothetical protein
VGGFFYAAKNAAYDFECVRYKSRKQFRLSGFGPPIAFDTVSFIIDYYPKIDFPGRNYVAFPDGNFVFAVGTFIYRGLIGADALSLFYRQNDFLPELQTAHGHFAIVLRKGGQTFLFKDPMGSYEVFLTRGGNCVTTSFLAAAVSAPCCTINVQETYEYVFNGVSLGDATLFAEIQRLNLFSRMTFEPHPALLTKDTVLTPEEDLGSARGLCAENLNGLTDYAETLTRAFGDNIKLALSGGYDSRLLLALFRHVGVTPRLFVYGSSGDQDVRVAKQIAKAEEIPLQHIDKALLQEATPDSYAEIVERNFLYEDGLPHGGIFTNGAELIARTWRNENGALHVNGGGGEVFRNFFNLLTYRSLTPRQFVWVFYSRFDPAECRDTFVPKRYEENIAKKVAALMGAKRARLSRREVESLYPFFRCRSWFGRENSVNSRWGYSVLPFFDHQTVARALRVPIRFKYFGDFESCLIRRADPALAHYPSNYQHDFSRNAPLATRVSDFLTYLRPPWLRRYGFRVRSRLRGHQPRPVLLSELFLARTIDPSFPFMSRYFKLDGMTSDLHFARICTLEYLFARIGARSW